MQEWLDNNNIPMYTIHNEGKSVIADRFIKTLKGKTHKRMTANDSKSYLSYFNELVDQYNNFSILLFVKSIETNSKAPELKVGGRVRITKYKNYFSKGYTESWSREISIIDSVLKTNPWTNKIKDLREEKIIGSFYVKGLLLL